MVSAEEALTSQELVPGQIYQVSLQVPSGVGLEQVTLLGNGTIDIGSQAILSDADGVAGRVVNLSAAATEIGASAQVGAVTAQGLIRLQDRSVVNGDVTTAGRIEEQSGVVVKGTRRANTPVPLEEVTAWEVAYPAITQGNVALEADQQRRLAPDAYGDVRVQPRAKLRLKSGTYYLKSLTVSSEGQLIIDDTYGPVEINVLNSLDFQGATSSESGRPANLRLTYLGQNSAFVRAPFRGALVAPNATVTLAPNGSATHEGSFFAKQLQVQGGTRIVHRARSACRTRTLS